MTAPEAERGAQHPLAMLLSPFGLKPEEAAVTLRFVFAAFLLLGGYALLKPVREALILSGGGAAVKSYASVGQALLLLAFVPAYAVLAARVSRARLVRTVSLAFAACLLVFGALAALDVPLLGVVFFLWMGVFNVAIVAQLWSVAADVFAREAGERLFPLIAFGASSGAVAGAFAAGPLARAAGIGAPMLLTAGLVVSTAWLLPLHAVPRGAAEATRAEATREEATREEAPVGTGDAFALVARSPYLLALAALVLVANWVNSNGEYVLSSLIVEHAKALSAVAKEQKLLINDAYSSFNFWVNSVSLLLQLFVVGRVLRWLGTRRAVLVTPLLAAAGYAVAAAWPVLGAVRWVKTAENAADYSLQNTLKGVLYLPLSRAEKYAGKQAIDTLGVRVGDGLSAGTVALSSVLAVGAREVALLNVVLVLAWLLAAWAVGRGYEARREGSGAERS